MSTVNKHSPSVCMFDGSLYATYYEGPSEGWEQYVKVVVYDAGWRTVKRLQLGTGNPVLFENHNRLCLAYTRFREATIGSRMVPRLWRNTDVLFHYVDDAEPFDRLTYMGCRCAPITINGTPVLPCYDEANCVSHFVKIRDDCVSVISSIIPPHGDRPLQPSIYFQRNAIHALCRDFSHHKLAGLALLYRYSPATGWTKRETTLPNHNESILAINTGAQPYVVFNAESGRRSLTIAYNDDARVLNESGHGSYPNYCWHDSDAFWLCWNDYNAMWRGEPNRIGLALVSRDLEILERRYIE